MDDRADSCHFCATQGFPDSTVVGHKNILALGFLEQGEKRVPVVACLGRFHMYEGHTPQNCVFPTRLFRCLGAQAIVGEPSVFHT